MALTKDDIIEAIAREIGTAGSLGYQRSRVAHVTELKEGRYRGHMVVGLSFLSKVS